MFPFEQKITLTFNTSNLDNLDKQELINRFIKQFDKVEENFSSITFKNFKAFYKRHKWLDSGHIDFYFKDKQIVLELQLNFYYVPVLFVFISIFLIIIHLDKIYLAGLLIVILWLIYILMYTWTALLFKSAIKNTVKHYLIANIIR